MNIIVAVDENFGIGYKNDLLYNIPLDKKFFREATTGKTVVMGRKTFESLPNGNPLPNRENIVLSKSGDFGNDGVKIYNDINKFLEEIDLHDSNDIFIIGGEEIYKLFLKRCEYAYVTKIKSRKKADKFFPNIDREKNWVLDDTILKSTHNEIEFEILKYKNVEL